MHDFEMETAVAELTLRNIRISFRSGLIPGYQNVRVELIDPATKRTSVVDCCDGPAPCVSLESPSGEVFDVHFPKDGGIKVF